MRCREEARADGRGRQEGKASRASQPVHEPDHHRSRSGTHVVRRLGGPLCREATPAEVPDSEPDQHAGDEELRGSFER